MNQQFKRDLTKLLNMYSVDAVCNIPDDVLAEYLVNTLQSLAAVAVYENKTVEIHVDGIKQVES